MNYSEAKAVAEAQGTAAINKVRKTVRIWIGAVALIMIIVVLAFWM